MPSFPGDNLDPGRCHGDLLLLVQSDHAMITHHAVRDVMRRTKGRLEGRWAQAGFQRFAEDKPSTRKRPGVADARGLLGFPDGSQNIAIDRRGADLHRGRGTSPGRAAGSYLAVRLIRLKIERWDRLSRTAQDDSIGPRQGHGRAAGREEGGGDSDARLADPARRPHPHGQPAPPG